MVLLLAPSGRRFPFALLPEPAALSPDAELYSGAADRRARVRSIHGRADPVGKRSS